MQSTTYKIQNDTINFGGGISSSTLYITADSLGEISTGYSSSTTYTDHAGFQQANQNTYITISAVTDVGLGNIGGLTGGASTGSSTWLVTTNNSAGYTLTVSASTSPALKSASAKFLDYAPTGPDPDLNFAVAATSSVFGFTPEGVDVIQRFRDNGSACNAGSGDTVSKCWDGFSTTSKSVATRNSPNHPSGSTTTIRYRAETGSSHIQESGAYAASITVTAIAL
jgi:hypothetical protein